jgi:hypothetical protein
MRGNHSKNNIEEQLAFGAICGQEASSTFCCLLEPPIVREYLFRRFRIRRVMIAPTLDLSCAPDPIAMFIHHRNEVSKTELEIQIPTHV